MNEDLKFIEDEIARIYTRIKAIRQGLHYSHTSTAAASAFAKAAVICAELNADPEIYVKAQFAHCDAARFANLLHTSNARTYYKKYVEEMTLSLDELYDINKMYLTSQITNAGRSVEDALMHDGLDLQPWFRICITKEPIPEVIQRYRAEAKAMLTPKLKNFLKSKNLDYTRISNE